MAVRRFESAGVLNYLLDLPVRAFFLLFSLLPYRASLCVAGWFSARVLAPLFGVNTRIRQNLNRVWPDMPVKDVNRLCNRVSDNSARLMLESFNVTSFLDRAARSELTGAGKDDLLQALNKGRPVVLVSGHFGNYQVIRVVLAAMGFATAAIYRPMNNAFTNHRYIDNMNRIATPNFPRGVAGTKGLLGHLRKGGAIALLNDQAAAEGALLTFFDEPALTMTSAAGFALKYGALLFPYYGVRLENGIDFRVEIHARIEPTDPETMSQNLNDSLEGMVRRYPEQWFWIHRRWKRWS